MTNRYDDDHHQHHHSIQPYFRKHRNSKFLPLLCRLSIKDVKINHSLSSSLSSSRKDIRTSSSSLDEYEPPSPRVGCMGQVKRNNRVIHFPTTSSTTTTVNVNEQALVAETRHHKYSKLKRLFSGKSNLLHHHPTAAAAAAVVAGRGRSNSRRSSRRDQILHSSSTNVISYNNSSRRFMRLKNNYCSTIKDDDGHHHYRECTVNIGEIDPPLPVVKVTANHHHEVNLWKRRFNNGVALKSLQIERVVH